MEDLYHQEYIKACRKLGLGDVTLHHRKIKDEPLSKEDWHQVYVATMAYQFQLTLIVANARAREEMKIKRSKENVGTE